MPFSFLYPQEQADRSTNLTWDPPLNHLDLLRNMPPETAQIRRSKRQSNPHALFCSTMNEIGVRMGASLYGHTPDGAGLLSK